MAQIASTVTTDAQVGDYVVFQISSTPAKQNTTIDFMRYQIDQVQLFNTYFTVYGRVWMVNQTVFNNDTKSLNQTQNLILSNYQLAYVTGYPVGDLIGRMNYIWQNTGSVNDYIDQLQSDADVMQNNFTAPIYGIVQPSVASNSFGYGFTITFSNGTDTLETITKIYSNTGFLTNYEINVANQYDVKYDLVTSQSSPIVSQQDLPLNLALIYSITFVAAIVIGLIWAKLRNRSKPKLAGDV